MTNIEFLKKYGLKTDIDSIKMGLIKRDYYTEIHWSEKFMELPLEPFKTFDEVVEALLVSDLNLLCSIAKKGERYEKVLKASRIVYEEQAIASDGIKRIEYNTAVKVLDELTTEVESKTK